MRLGRASAFANITIAPLVPPDSLGFTEESSTSTSVTFIWNNAPPLGTSVLRKTPAATALYRPKNALFSGGIKSIARGRRGT